MTDIANGAPVSSISALPAAPELDPEAPTSPEPFRLAVASLSATAIRREARVESIRAPQRLAPWTYALSTDIVAADGDELATGRLVLLYDPDGAEAWDGELRLVAFASAEVEPDIATDPLLPQVAWNWLTSSLQERSADFVAAGGTVTQTTSTRFGDVHGPATTVSLETTGIVDRPDHRSDPPFAGLRRHVVHSRRIATRRREYSANHLMSAAKSDDAMTAGSAGARDVASADVSAFSRPSHPDRDGGDSSDTTDIADSAEESSPEVPLLRVPADGVPEPITSARQLREVSAGFAAAEGPVAVDAERASGYRYSQRAYLVQLRRAGYGTVLIDPIALPDLSELNDAIGSAEWILHAAHQDLPCLAEIGLVPARLFDTELAGRLLGEERVALGTMVERYLGVRLEKGHSAADWSTRPLPHDWLIYAALDVELLIELRNVLVGELAAAGKTEWAAQEFAAAIGAPPPAPRVEPWRRTSGIHSLRNRRQLAAVRSLWEARDIYASGRDVAPGRVLPDAAIIDAARRAPVTTNDLLALPVFGGSRQRRVVDRWFGALESARLLPDDELPATTGPTSDLVPPTGRWRERAPEAAARLAAVREVVAELAERHQILAQNLLPSDIVRRISWEPPAPLDTSTVLARLADLGARQWQIELVGADITIALTVAEPVEDATDPADPVAATPTVDVAAVDVAVIGPRAAEPPPDA